MSKPETARRKSKAAGPLLRITLVRSPIGSSERHKATLRALGLRRRLQTVEKTDTPQIRGMVAKVAHLVTVATPAPAPVKEKKG